MDAQNEWAEPWWSSVDEGTAAQWTRNYRTGETKCIGLVMYGDITATRLRTIRVGDLDPTSYQVTGESGAPPSGVVRWIHERSEAIKAETAAEKPERVYVFPPRKPGESADSFYGRLEALMRQLRQDHPSGPVKKLAEVMGVPFSTAVYWNNELKKREGTK